MIHTVYGSDKDSVGLMIAGHFKNNTGHPTTAPYAAMGFIKDDKLIGQMIFNDYTGANMDIHMYAPNCFHRKTIRDVYNFVFNTNGCERLTAKPTKRNEKLLHILERIGFVYEFTQERYYKEPDGTILDALVYKLTREAIPHWVKLDAEQP